MDRSLSLCKRDETLHRMMGKKMLGIAKHTGQYLELARLLFKYGGGEFASALGLSGFDTSDDDGDATPESLARDIEKLGPTYIKLAQIASTREDLIASDYIEALQRLQDDVEPVSSEQIHESIEAELEVKPSVLFRDFDDKPLACASLGQVHRATLRDGRDVVVKVLRPGVEDDAKQQLDVLRPLAKLADQKTDVGRKFRFSSLLDAVEYALSLELDYRTEAANLERLAENLHEFDLIQLPKPIPAMVSRRVLVMERLSGTSLKDVSGVVLNELDTDAMANQIIEAYLKQILVDGLFHADPHPGNLLLTEEHRLGLIDGGMVVSVSPGLRRKLGAFLIAISEREGEEAARIAYELGRVEDGFQMDAFAPAAARVIARPDESPTQSLSPGKTSIMLLNVAGEHGLVLPFELILFSKAILQVENTVFGLNPNLDVRGIIKQYGARLLMERAGETLSLGQATKAALDSAEFARHLPQRLNRITELVSENALRVKVDAIDQNQLMASIRKIANRITAGLVISALIVGASLLMRVEVGPSAFGYPILATSFFIVAALCGLYLVWLALVKDN
jgi:predicted unusual protein kinase regulating ubiquinone biosynthesis (AarF/ABC1/UbiB family)